MLEVFVYWHAGVLDLLLYGESHPSEPWPFFRGERRCRRISTQNCAGGRLVAESALAFFSPCSEPVDYLGLLSYGESRPSGL